MDAEELFVYRKHKAAETIQAWPYEKVSKNLSDIIDLPTPGAAEWTPWDQSFYDFVDLHKEGKFLVGNVGEDSWFLFAPASGELPDAGLWFILAPQMKAKGVLGNRALVALREVATDRGLI
ncbi:MAG: hypothetical protein ACAI35_22265 [Candidatus Methylacidiphilales bacterium]|nr:hypothetical protein [Candidatus Methylacidiphilales bacterium]